MGGCLTNPLWQHMGGFVWGYALAWFLVTDRVKLLAYWLLDRVMATPAATTSLPLIEELMEIDRIAKARR
jgi:hypothetical protein